MRGKRQECYSPKVLRFSIDINSCVSGDAELSVWCDMRVGWVFAMIRCEMVGINWLLEWRVFAVNEECGIKRAECHCEAKVLAADVIRFYFGARQARPRGHTEDKLFESSKESLGLSNRDLRSKTL